MYTYLYLAISIFILLAVSIFTLITTLSKWWFIGYCRFISGVPGYILFVAGITLVHLCSLNRATVVILLASIVLMIAMYMEKKKYS